MSKVIKCFRVQERVSNTLVHDLTADGLLCVRPGQSVEDRVKECYGLGPGQYFADYVKSLVQDDSY